MLLPTGVNKITLTHVLT